MGRRLPNEVVPGGFAENPLKARWIGIVNGVGIHGTGEECSIGTRASHGCIRMRVADVIALYPEVPVGTPVLISVRTFGPFGQRRAPDTRLPACG